MNCAQRTSLVQLCDRFIKEYAEAVAELNALSGRVSRQEWDLAWLAADRAGKKSDEILMNLKRHTDEHGC
jgi:hypothetical protein